MESLKDKLFIGIDPGISGAIVMLSPIELSYNKLENYEPNTTMIIANPVDPSKKQILYRLLLNNCSLMPIEKSIDNIPIQNRFINSQKLDFIFQDFWESYGHRCIHITCEYPFTSSKDSGYSMLTYGINFGILLSAIQRNGNYDRTKFILPIKWTSYFKKFLTRNILDNASLKENKKLLGRALFFNFVSPDDISFTGIGKVAYSKIKGAGIHDAFSIALYTILNTIQDHGYEVSLVLNKDFYNILKGISSGR